ncbi:hypothetical protein Gotur_008130 [Gossypium turneri]
MKFVLRKKIRDCHPHQNPPKMHLIRMHKIQMELVHK